jgi:hypothetical protein
MRALQPVPLPGLPDRVTIGATIAAIQRGDLHRRTGLSAAEAFTELSTFVLCALQPNPEEPTASADSGGYASHLFRRRRVGVRRRRTRRG